MIQDTCDTDKFIRDAVRGILTDYEIDGDSYHVPPIEEIVELLVKKIKE